MLATGCVEQPMVFRNNDLPGVMLASAAQRLMRLWGVSPGRQAVVVDRQPGGLRHGPGSSRCRRRRAGRARPARGPGAVPRPRRAARPWRAGARRLDGGRGPARPCRGRLEGAVIDRVTGEGRTAGTGAAIACDLIVTSVGVAPLGQLACGVGARFAYDEALATLSGRGAARGRAPRRLRSTSATRSTPSWPTVRRPPASPSAAAIPGRSSRILRARTSSTSTRTRPCTTCSTPSPTGSTIPSSPSATPPPPWARARGATRR